MIKSVGICIGASNIKFVKIQVDNNSIQIVDQNKIHHQSHPKKALFDLINDFQLYHSDFLCVTGRNFKKALNIKTISEPVAIEYALQEINLPLEEFHLVSLGSENFILYELNSDKQIINIHTGSKCASGTGEFYLQQISRMNLTLEDSILMAQKEKPYRVSGRCSVFCKSDCTHALNKGTPIGQVTAGLGEMLAEKVIELSEKIQANNLIAIGGVTNNSYVMNALKKQINNLFIPQIADYFEAFGTAIYAYKNHIKTEQIKINEKHNSFSNLPPLQNSSKLVHFNPAKKVDFSAQNEYILGLDVGSTTTKAVLLDYKTNDIVSKVYLRTNGDPILASKNCYKQILSDLIERSPKIIGLGVTGSGRYITALHAETNAIINEIIAHAKAATFYDKDVDTIFEIGGQDAKYTFLHKGVPCDYAMNEACSAGTGSFLEESAKENFGLHYSEIEKIAFLSTNPPNFNDQCSAFISSDIKHASHENIPREDIIAGLVYSICTNYKNRVVGNRKIGTKIYMQGGVCYNKVVPIAMANLLNKEIIIPPEPGLMGAFGVGLEVIDMLKNKLLKKKEFNLSELINRKVIYHNSFICNGLQENCDRKCTINIIEVNNHKFPFGGACDKYYNKNFSKKSVNNDKNLVNARQDEVFSYMNTNHKNLKIGISKSFLTNTLYPLYHTFFTELGCEIILSEEIDEEGIKKAHNSFCYPAEVSYGYLENLIKQSPDFYFLPHIVELYVEKSISRKKEHQSTCVILQGEKYFLQSKYPEIQHKILSPVLNFSHGWDKGKDEFLKIAKLLHFTQSEGELAFQKAINQQLDFFQNNKTRGKKTLKYLENHPKEIGIVIFGRSYNAYSNDTNMGIPQKFASKNIITIPHDSLPFEDENSYENMTWATGQDILKAAEYVKKHPQLFAVYVTNFSCGPDSFLVSYMRDIMQNKPSLTLEIDSHVADAGINTRIEAFLDIIKRYNLLEKETQLKNTFKPAKLIFENSRLQYLTSNAEKVSLYDKKIKIIFPSMGRCGSELFASAFRGIGFNSEAVDLPDMNTLIKGKSKTTGKECLPLILTTGSLLEYYEKYKQKNDLLIYFMPTSSGNCRFSQYYIYLQKIIEKEQLANVALLTLKSENNYAGIGILNQLNILKAVIVSDVLDDIKNSLKALAINKDEALKIFNSEFEKVKQCFENKTKGLSQVLTKFAKNISKIPLKMPYSQAKKVLIAGEIYVRKDEFSTEKLTQKLEENSIVIHRSPILEWLYYVDYLVEIGLHDTDKNLKTKLEILGRKIIQNKLESKIKRILAKSNLYEYHMIDIKKIVEIGSKFVDINLTGESIIVTGALFSEIAKNYHGMISVGPFACLPTRLIESILVNESRLYKNAKIKELNLKHIEGLNTLPFLSVEIDGNEFPQILDSKIEAFALQVERMYINNEVKK